MSFFFFLFKKVRRKWLTILPILLIAAFIVVVYLGGRNANINWMSDPKYSDAQEIKYLEENIVQSKLEIVRYETTSESYKKALFLIQKDEENLTLLQAKLDAFEHENWKKYYESSEALHVFALERMKYDKASRDDELAQVFKQNQKYDNYMAKHGLALDDRFKPYQGFSYMMDVVENYLPFILTILTIFLVSIMYCASFFDDRDIHALLPISRVKRQRTKLFVGVTIGIFVFMFFVILSIICGSVGNTIGNFQTPVLTYSLTDIKVYVPLLSVLPQLLLLTLLSILFLVNFVSIVSLLTKKAMLCFIISLAVLLGFMWMTTNIVPLFSIAHLLPTTYVSSLAVISGELMNITNNSNIHFLNGVFVLTLSNCVIFALYYYGSKISVKWVKK